MREHGSSVPGGTTMAVSVLHCGRRKTAYRSKTVGGLENEVRKYVEALHQ